MAASPITTALLASAVPAPVVPAAYNDLVAALAGTPASAIAKPLGTGDGANMIAYWTFNAAVQDAASRYGGGGCYAVNKGLTLSALTNSYTLTVAQGQATIDGPVQVPSGGTTYPLPGSQAHIYIWLKQDGTIYHTLTTAPPTATCVYLGHCATDGSGCTGIDTAGIVYWNSGVPERATGDSGAPTDSPNARITLISKTAFGSYLWDGTGHRQLGIPHVSADPSTPQNGEIWFRDDLLQLCVRTGGATKKTAVLT